MSSIKDRLLFLSNNIPVSIAGDTKKEAKLLEKIAELEKYVRDLSELDMHLIETVTGHLSKRPDDTYDLKSFPLKLDEISEDSTIIFLKNAELFKVYNTEELLESFVNNVNCDFKNRGPVYEVVRDAYPQKLIIVIEDDVQDRLQLMKTHITEFIAQDPKFKKVGTADLVVYKTTSTTEFIAVNNILKNIHEKEEFMEDFKRYMKTKGEAVVANKIQIRPPATDIKGVRFYELPKNKTILSGNYNDSLNHLINQVSVANPNSSTPTVINLTVNNIVNGNVNSNNTNTTTNNIINTGKTVKAFYKHLYNTKPSWYVENALVDMEHIVNAYREFFNDSTILATHVSKKLNGGLYNNGTRTNGVTKKKLVSYATLRGLF